MVHAPEASPDGHPRAGPPQRSVPIEEYALIGDMRTAALVSRAGSIDWLCLPRFDSPACFAALLGGPRHGRWLITPVDPALTTRRYLEGTVVLETTHTTASGVVTVTDAMPTRDGQADVVRRIHGVRGEVRLLQEWVVRFGYGAVTPWVFRQRRGEADETLTAIAGPDALALRGPELPVADEARHRHELLVRAGDDLTYTMTWWPSHQAPPRPHDPETVVDATVERYRAWSDGCDYDGGYAEAVRTSVTVLRALTDHRTGGIVAAPTTSLPEDWGGVRNWDYRYCWLRDASLTLLALLRAGYRDETRAWRDWLTRAVAGDARQLQIVYAVDGGRDLFERELDHLPGYAGSRPVRIGNGAVAQRQNDVLGEVMIALDAARDLGLADTGQSWAMQRSLVDDLCQTWDVPDHGLWEVRGPRRRFTHSRALAWAAFDRAVRAVEVHGLDGPVDRWRAERDRVRADVLAHGVASAGHFTQHDQTTEVDAALLLLAPIGFVAPDDPTYLATVAAVERDLLRDGLVLRYRCGTGVDGLPGVDHPFLACTFWLVQAYALTGRRDEGHALMRSLLALRNDVGLLPEEYDPVTRRFVGNYPQAFSHLALIGAAHALDRATALARGSSAPAPAPGR